MTRQFYIVDGGQTGPCVFMGYSEEPPIVGQPYTLKQARMILSWSAEYLGLVGLAARGPLVGTRITPPMAKISNVICRQVLPISPKVQAAFEAWAVSRQGEQAIR